MSLDLILFFIPTIASVSFTPGLCMTLAFTLGLSIGYKRTLWMMLGELSGVASVFTATFWSLGWLLSRDPIYFQIISFVGGVYLLYLAFQLFRETPEAIESRDLKKTQPMTLATLGYVTAVSNPKGWAFLMACFIRYRTCSSIHHHDGDHADNLVCIDDCICNRWTVACESIEQQ